MGKKKRSPQTIGYAYFLGLAYALCTKVDRLLEFRLNGDIGAKPNLVGSGEFVAKTGKSAPSPNGSGKSTSTVKFYDGSQTTADPYLASKTGSNIAYKNTAYLVINGFIGDNVSSVPQYSAVVERTNIVPKWANISGLKQSLGGDANPACVLWYMFTKLINLNERLLDEASFKDAAIKLSSENLGVSFVMSSPQEAKEWVEEILRTIDGVMCINPKSGALGLRLLRDDYDPKKVKIVNEGNSNKVKFTRKSWSDTYSKGTVKFTDRNTFESASVTAINSATRQTLGYERAYNVEYMAISTHENANKILQRLMKKISYPLATIKFNLSGDEFRELMVGDTLLFSNEKLGVKNMKIRVIKLGGEKDNKEIDVEAIEDVFNMENIVITSVQPSLYEPIDLSIGEIEYYGAVEATAEMGEMQGVLPFMVTPKGFVQHLSVKDGLSGDKQEMKSWTLGVLSSDLEISDEIDNDAFFEIDEITPLWKISATRAGWQRLKMTCVIDGEFINFQYRDDLGGGKWRVRTLMRGLSETKITSHKKGAKVWFAPVDANDLTTLSIISPSTNIIFEASNFENSSEPKRLPFNHSKEASKPYPISNLKAFRDGEIINLSWRNCVRLHGANYRSADTIVAGVDEGLIENYVLIRYENNEIKVKDEKISIECKNRTKFTIYNVAYETGILSDAVTITI